MNKTIQNFIIAILIVLFVISCVSCKSVYEDVPEITQKRSFEVDPNEEYFTLGEAISINDTGARIYQDTWIYAETQKYQKYYKTSPEGERKYSEKSINRFVKYNAHTGEVSSLCLNPSCTHGPESGCIMISPGGKCTIQGIVGDWIVFSYQHFVKELKFYMPESYVYNLKTGETIDLLQYDISGATLNRTVSWCFFENKLYLTRNVLDYSGTKYKPGNISTIERYFPETKSYLLEYDFDKKSLTTLRELPAFYKVCVVTNKRFFLINDNKEIFSCDKNGGEIVKENVLDFSPQHYCGTFGYDFDTTNSQILIYDLRTDTKSVIPMEFSYQRCYLTNEGIIFSTFSTADESFLKLENSRNEFANDNEFASAINKHRYEATPLIYLMDFDGTNSRLIYTGPQHIFLDAYNKTENFLYATVSYPDPNNNFFTSISTENSDKHVINIKTGEMVALPYLDLIIPEEYK